MAGNRKTLSALLAILTACSFSTAAFGSDTDPAAASAQPEDVRISYLGPEGTYTEEAAHAFFSSGSFQPKDTVPEAIADITAADADYAVIPQENTLGGAVTAYIDALIAETDIYVVGEVILPINQTLMGVPGASIDDIRTVCSHVQGLAQSAEWREEHLPDAAAEEMASTAAAASYVSESGDKSIAAIAAPGAAELYGLSVLAENVQITDANKTRFYILSSSRPETEGQTNAVFVAGCAANRLDDILIEIHDTGAELVTIHDRPEGSQLGNYNYIIEIESESGLSEALIEELDTIPEMHFLGSFNVTQKGSKS